MKCIYHSNDLDGECSGAIVKHFLPTCEMIPYKYGDIINWDIFIDKNETVYMCDVSFQPFSDMVKLSEKCRLIWIDHHISAIEQADRTPEFICYNRLTRVDYSGCELTYRYFDEEYLPEFVRLLGRYDVWDHSDPRTIPFQYGMRCYDTNPTGAIWEQLFQQELGLLTEMISNAGKDIVKYVWRENKKFTDTLAFPTGFEGYKVIAVNKLSCSSQFFDGIPDINSFDIMMPFGYNGQNKLWTYSMYTTKDIDVSVIARKYGGGGHAKASGFQSKNQILF